MAVFIGRLTLGSDGPERFPLGVPRDCWSRVQLRQQQKLKQGQRKRQGARVHPGLHPLGVKADVGQGKACTPQALSRGAV